MRTLPVGNADFSSFRGTDSVYADKTGLIYELVKTGSGYLLSRPRGFGTTLLVNTIEAVFEGRRELFKRLAIDGTDYD
jgi:hypothetical protein